MPAKDLFRSNIVGLLYCIVLYCIVCLLLLAPLFVGIGLSQKVISDCSWKFYQDPKGYRHGNNKLCIRGLFRVIWMPIRIQHFFHRVAPHYQYQYAFILFSPILWINGTIS